MSTEVPGYVSKTDLVAANGGDGHLDLVPDQQRLPDFACDD